MTDETQATDQAPAEGGAIAAAAAALADGAGQAAVEVQVEPKIDELGRTYATGKEGDKCTDPRPGWLESPPPSRESRG